jgi:electron transfer flavoprotein alpha/beta subunit
MNIIVLAKLVPDLVEELTIDTNGTALDTAWLRMIINEFDDHAIEQGILLWLRISRVWMMFFSLRLPKVLTG